jgi:hypothetical protein
MEKHSLLPDALEMPAEGQEKHVVIVIRKERSSLHM